VAARVDAELRPALARFAQKPNDPNAPIPRDSPHGQVLKEFIDSGVDPQKADWFLRKYDVVVNDYNGLKDMARRFVRHLTDTSNREAAWAASNFVDVNSRYSPPITAALNLPNGASKDAAALTAFTQARQGWQQFIDAMARRSGETMQEAVDGQVVFVSDPKRYVHGQAAEYLADTTERGVYPGYTGPAVWHSPQGDANVTITGTAGAKEGVTYHTVAESATAIPETELSQPPLWRAPGAAAARQSVAPAQPAGAVTGRPAWATSVSHSEAEYSGPSIRQAYKAYHTAEAAAARQAGVAYSEAPYPGWKIHLNVARDFNDPVTRAIGDFLYGQDLQFKIGMGGEEGKGMTVYVGSRDRLEAVAAEINRRFGNQLGPIAGDALVDDLPVAGNVAARFAPQGDGWHQYGYKSPGLPLLKADHDLLATMQIGDPAAVGMATFQAQLSRAQAVARRRAFDEYGAYYVGTDRWRQVESLDASRRADSAYELLASQPLAQRAATAPSASDALRAATAPKAVPDASEATVAKGADDLLTRAVQDLAANYGTSQRVGGVPPDILEGWTNDALQDLNTVKTMASRIGVAGRDFALLDYTDKRSIDPLLTTLLLYPYWSSRTYPHWLQRAMMHPKVIANYLRFQRQVREKNKDQPEWAQDMIRSDWVPGLPDGMYFNVRSIMDPMYNLFSTFDDPERQTTALGRAITAVDRSGFNLHPLFSWLLAAERYIAGKPREAEAAVGYFAGVTRAARYVSGKLGINEGMGFTTEPWLWRGGIGIGGDKWTIRRAQTQLADMQQRGDITPEEAREAAYAWSQGNYDHPIVKRAMAAEVDARFGPTLFAYVTGMPIRTETPEDAKVNEAVAAQSAIYDSQASMSKEAWSAAWDDFYAQYPFMRTLSMSRADRLQGDSKWVYDVLSRLPPGQSTDIMAEAGVPKELLDRFYEAKGFSTKDGTPTLKESERMRLVAAALDLSTRYNIPTTAMTLQWEEVKERLSDMYETADRKFAGAQQLETRYYELREQDPEAAKTFLDTNPDLRTYWEWKADYRRSDPLLQFFYGDTPRDQAVDLFWESYFAIPKGRRNDFLSNFDSDFVSNVMDKKYDAIPDTMWFNVVAYLGGMMYRSAQAEAPGEQPVAPRDIRVTTPEQMSPTAKETLEAIEAR